MFIILTKTLEGIRRKKKLADKKQKTAKEPGEKNSHRGNNELNELKLAELSLDQVLLLGWVNSSFEENRS